MGEKREKSDTILLIAVVLPPKEKSAAESSGRVTSRAVTDEYCRGWENIFGKRQEVGQA